VRHHDNVTSSCLGINGRIPKFPRSVVTVNLPTRHRNGDATAAHWIIAAWSLGSHLRSTHAEY
jgi:hypothetical protein